MNNSKKQFIDFCNQRVDLPIFSTAKWLDCVAKNWEVVIYEQDNKIRAFLPYSVTKKMGFTTLHNPPLTPYLGVWFEPQYELKEATRLGNEKEIISNLLNQPPYFDSFNCNFNPIFTNWYPFYLNSYSQTTRYTYIFNQPFDIKELFSGLKSQLRSHIQKAEQELIIEESENIEDLFFLKHLAKKDNPNIPIFSNKIYRNVFNFCKKENCGTLLTATDKENNIHSSILLVWDTTFCYLLHGASDPKFKQSNAMSSLIWDAIKLANSKKLSFNFEGSMIESVEQHFRFFNAKQTPYFNISKTNSKILKFKQFIKSF